ncbi:copper chaperone PCu(A)C [Rhodobiaceae bacterium]|nr:copper chaperone PCu(A)C [Rhodobiaceae bacterium]
MEHRFTTKWLAVAAALITVGALAALARAAEPEIGLSDAWARPTLGAGRTTAAYVTITNMGTNADRLTAVDAPGAGSVEIHTAGMENGVMRMRRLEGLDIPAGETVAMAPGGYHIMIIDVEEPVQTGSTVPLTLTFETSGNVTIDATVSMTPPSSTSSQPVENTAEDMGDHQDMMHGGH